MWHAGGPAEGLASRGWMVGRESGLGDHKPAAHRMRSLWPWLVYASLTMLVLTPIFSVQVPCLGDYLNHLARISILGRIGHSPELTAFYRADWKFVPYYGMDVPVLLLSAFMTIYQAGRIFVAACVIMPVLSVAALHYAIYRRFSLVPACAFLFCYGHMLDRGFLNYLFASGLAVMLFAVWVATIRMPRAPRLALFAPGIALLYLCHAFALADYCVLVAGLEIGRSLAARPRSARQAAVDWSVAAAPALPTLLIGALCGGNANVSAHAFNHYGNVLDKLGAVLSPFYFPSYGGAGVMATTGTLLLVLVCFVRARRLLVFSPLLIGPAVAVAVAAIITPSVLFDVWGADFRVPSLLVVVLLAGIAPAPALGRRGAAMILASVMLLVAMRSADATMLLRGLDAQVTELRQLLRALPMGMRLLVVEDRGTGQTDTPAPAAMSGHIAMVAVIDRDAFVPFLFTGTSALQLQPNLAASGSTASEAIDMARLRDGIVRRDPPSGPPPFGWGGHMYWLGWPEKFDYVLLEHPGAHTGPVPAILLPVAHAGIADLFAIAGGIWRARPQTPR
jgi:hypothetical protein